MGTGKDGIEDPKSSRVTVLRLGHRPDRDKRITTHVALVSRAFGASGIIVDTKDLKLEETIRKVGSQFGGEFTIETGASSGSILSHFDGTIVHLTMYGERVDDAVGKIPEGEDLLVVVGSEKVPRKVFDLSHFNISVSNQPHSEVSALAIFLDRYFKGTQLFLDPGGGEIHIVPDARGKTVVTDENRNAAPRGRGFHDRKWSIVPDEQECLEILRAAGCSGIVVEHSRAVFDLGMELISRVEEGPLGKTHGIDLAKLSAGLLLHDLGRSRTHSIRHSIIGAQLAESVNIHPDIVAMIKNHVGGGLSGREAAELGLPEMDFFPSSIEEKIVSHADNLIGNTNRRPLEKAVDRLRHKGAVQGAERVIALHRELEEALCIDIDPLVETKRGLDDR